jgi:uncharacterized protein
MSDPSWNYHDAVSISSGSLDILLPRSQIEDLKILENDADAGLTEAQYQLGKCYEEGIGFLPSYTKAFSYYKLAADQGHATAQKHVALLYERGLGTRKSRKLAFYYYKLAADQGDSGAQSQIGKCYEEGWGIKKSIDRAISIMNWLPIKEILLP